MQCRRCNGLKVLELMLDGGMRALAYRCVHCGDLVDEKIQHHRDRKVMPPKSRPRTPIFGSPRFSRPVRRRALSPIPSGDEAHHTPISS